MSPDPEPNLSSPSAAPRLPPELEAQVRALVEDYENRLLAGEEPDLYEFLLAHAPLAAHLGPRLEAVESLHGLARARWDPGPAAVVAEDGPPPAFLGRYRVEGVLGRGVSAVVYQAYDPKFDRRVALKARRAQDPGSEQASRFARDALILARLRHPNIVPLHDTGEHDGLRYLDMELVEGETLEERLQRPSGRYALRQAAELVHRLALALDYAHEAGVVHRDVKPANVLLDARGEPQLTDFGLARGDGAGTLTADGAILGTPAYMSPEQADGRGRDADRRSDVYSLGVVLYRLLTGRLPFDAGGSVSALLFNILHREPPAPRAAVPGVPRDLETICLKALEKRPEDRFPTARAFADELWRWLHDEPLRIRRPTLLERVRRWARRNPPATAFAALAVLLLAAVVGTFLGLAAAHRAYDAESQRRARLEEETAALRGKRDRLEQEMAALLEKRLQTEEQLLLRAAWQRVGTPAQGQRFETLELLRRAAQVRPAGARPAAAELRLDLRALWVAALSLPDIRVVRDARLPHCPFVVWPAALHPDGREVVIASQAGLIWWDGDRAPAVPEQLHTDSRRIRLAYSPDGKLLAFVRADGQLELWDAVARRRLAEGLGGRAARVLAVAFDPAGNALLCCRADGRVESWSLPGLKPGRSWQAPARDGTAYTAAAFNADGTRLALGDRDGGVVRYDGGGALLGERDGVRAMVEALAWSPDSQRLAVGMRYGAVRLLDLKGGRHQDFAVAGPEVRHVLFSPDGRWLFAGTRPQAARAWDVATGAPVLTSHSVPLNFARDGRRFVGGRVNGVGVCDLVRPTLMRPLRGHRSPVEWVTWSRDGTRLATMDATFEIRVWDLSRGLARGVPQVAGFQAAHGTYWTANAALALSDDGRWLGYASGGDAAQALLVDLRTGRKYGPWRLPPGFDRLVYASGRFLSVREEEAADGGPLRTVARELTPDGLRLLSPRVRMSEPGEQGFFTSGVSRDGRYYWWAGPRAPVEAIRFEVCEVATGKRILRRDFPQKAAGLEIYGLIAPDGRHWATETPWPAPYLVGRLGSDETPRRIKDLPIAVSLDGAWSVRLHARRKDRPGLRALQPFPQGEVSLEFPVGAGKFSEVAMVFSADSRYLAWAGPDHTVLVAELPALRAAADAFEKAVGLR